MKKEKSNKKTASTPKGLSKTTLNIIAVTIILIATYIAFAPSLKCAFTNWDDPTYVLENPLLKSTSSENLKKIFSPSTFVSCNYHPITIASLAMDYSKVKYEPYRYHLVNLLFHLLNTALVFVFILLLSKRKTMVAFIVALFFGIHPMHVESVTWVSERKDVLYCFFFLLSLIFYLLYTEREHKKALNFSLSFVFFILSCLSKAMAVVLPVALVLIDVYQNRSFNKKVIFEKIPFFIIAIILGLVAVEAQRTEAIAKFETFTLFQRFMFASYGLLRYIEKLVVPIDLSALYPYPFLIDGKRLPYIFYIAPFIVAGIAFLVYYSMRFTKVVLFGFGFYLAAVAMVLQFVSVGIAIMADRYTYVSYIGLLFMVGMGYNWVAENKSNYKNILLGVLLIGAGFFVYTTRERTLVWENSETLWTDVIKKYPVVGAETAFKNRGNFYADKQQYDKALVDYNNYILLKKDDAKIYTNRGNIYGLQGKFDLSLADYSRSIELLPQNNIEAYLNRGITYSMMKEHQKALLDYEKALQISPGLLKVYQNRAYTYLDMGDNVNAISDYSNVIKATPDEANPYFYRGLAYYRMGDKEKAIADNSKTIELNPSFANAYFNRSVLYKETGNFAGALQDALKAQSLGYQVPQSHIDELKKRSSR